MFLEERVPQYLQEIKEKYYCDDLDFSEINKNKKVVMRKGGGKKFIRELNEQIDLDFIKESNLLEDVQDVDVSAFLEDEDTEVTHYYQEKRDLFNLDPVAMAKESVRGCVVMATNPKLGILAFTNEHLAAFKYVLREARSSQLTKKETGHFGPLTHDVITTANEMILPGEYHVPSFYRDEYTIGGCHVTGANWTPVANSKVPAKMEALVRWYNEENELNPIIKAAILHCEFIAIHPFSDGNGRTARLLVNYELAKNNLPTIVIKSRNKKAYLAALEKGIMTGDVTDVAKMISERVLASQHKQIKAIDKFYSSQKMPNNCKE